MGDGAGLTWAQVFVIMRTDVSFTGGAVGASGTQA
jgi:hypothetical protein